MSELYYAEMEAARNEAEDRYFAVRPEYDIAKHRRYFRAGFESAFQKLWREPVAGECVNPDCPGGLKR